MSDLYERNGHTDAHENDTDGDGLNDASEIRIGSGATSEFTAPSIDTYGSGGEQCALELTVRIEKVTDSDANSAVADNAFCQGQ